MFSVIRFVCFFHRFEGGGLAGEQWSPLLTGGEGYFPYSSKSIKIGIKLIEKQEEYREKKIEKYIS